MSTTIETGVVAPAAQASAPRIASIDIFRGLTMVVMIFVNDLSSVHGLPWWTYHAPGRLDYMTYVDMVYPFFLFIVGMAIPLAIRTRLKKNPSLGSLWLHVLLRTFSLLALGLILANAEKGDPTKMGISSNLWAILGLICAGLFLNVYPASSGSNKLFRSLRIAGFVGVLVLYAIFRRTAPDGHTYWLSVSYPEILGLIGYTYFAVCLLYIPTRRWRWASVAWFVALMWLCTLYTAHHLEFLRHVPWHYWPFGNGAMAAIVMAGIVTSSIFLGPHALKTNRQKLSTGFALGLAILFFGWLYAPLGISKIRATPTWCFWSIGAAILCFTALYWICDVQKSVAWASFFRPAGSNTLLTYLLPDLYYFTAAAVGFTYLNSHFAYGWPGVVRSVLFTGVMLALAGLLTKCRIRLQL